MGIFFFNTSSLEIFPSLLIGRLGNSLENLNLSKVFLTQPYPHLEGNMDGSAHLGENGMYRDFKCQFGLAEMRMLSGGKGRFLQHGACPSRSEPGFLPASLGGNEAGIGSKPLNCRHVERLT